MVDDEVKYPLLQRIIVSCFDPWYLQTNYISYLLFTASPLSFPAFIYLVDLTWIIKMDSMLGKYLNTYINRVEVIVKGLCRKPQGLALEICWFTVDSVDFRGA